MSFLFQIRPSKAYVDHLDVLLLALEHEHARLTTAEKIRAHACTPPKHSHSLHCVAPLVKASKLLRCAHIPRYISSLGHKVGTCTRTHSLDTPLCCQATDSVFVELLRSTTLHYRPPLHYRSSTLRLI